MPKQARPHRHHIAVDLGTSGYDWLVDQQWACFIEWARA